MKFLTYLLEKRSYSTTRSTVISVDEAIALVKKNCKQIIRQYNENSRRIWRGTPGAGQFLVSDPTIGERRSANTSNFYTMLMDNLPEWASFPKRSKSLVCTTDSFKASFYGHPGSSNPYYVFPFDSCKIAMCPYDDIWSTELHINNRKLRLVDFNSVLRQFTYDDDADRNWAELKRNLLLKIADMQKFDINTLATPSITTMCAKLGVTNTFGMDLYNGFLASKKKNFIAYLGSIFNPQTTNTKLITPSQLPSEAHELWIGDGKCVLVQNRDSKFEEAGFVKYKKFCAGVKVGAV